MLFLETHAFKNQLHIQIFNKIKLAAILFYKRFR